MNQKKRVWISVNEVRKVLQTAEDNLPKFKCPECNESGCDDTLLHEKTILNWIRERLVI